MTDIPNSDSSRVGFCQDCGCPLTRETARPVGAALFCEPCLEIRLAGSGRAGTIPGAGGAAANTGASGFGSPAPSASTAPPGGRPSAASYTTVPFTAAPGGSVPPVSGDKPSPVLAGFLGFIPGVGAMYNGQFGKAIAHVVIFFLLESMHRVNDFFGFLCFLWCIYQAFDAYHTARARLEGRPLPNPFGLNDIADNMSFMSRFHHGRPPTATPPSQPGAGSTNAWHAGPDATAPPYTAHPPYASAGYASAEHPVATPDFHAAAFPAPGGAAVPPYRTVSGTGYASDPASAVPFSAAPGPVPTTPVPGNQFPALAFWLIGLGTLFLLITIGSAHWSAAHVAPFILAALSVGLFIRKMTACGGLGRTAEEESSGSPHLYTARIAHALTAPGMLMVVAVLTGLENFAIAPWNTTWPILVIALGMFLLLDRALRRARA